MARAHKLSSSTVRECIDRIYYADKNKMDARREVIKKRQRAEYRFRISTIYQWLNGYHTFEATAVGSFQILLNIYQ